MWEFDGEGGEFLGNLRFYIHYFLTHTLRIRSFAFARSLVPPLIEERKDRKTIPRIRMETSSPR